MDATVTRRSRRKPLVPFICMVLVYACLLSSCGPMPVASARGHAQPSPSATPPASLPLAPTSSCGHAPPIPAGTSADLTLPVGNLTRTYRLHVPADYTSGHLQPLVLLFHGHGSNALVMERSTGFSPSRIRTTSSPSIRKAGSAQVG